MNNEDKEWHDAIDKRVEQAKRDYQGPHCCLVMDNALKIYTDTFYCVDGKYTLKDPVSGDHIECYYCVFCRGKFNER
jgi:hypothetical protein